MRLLLNLITFCSGKQLRVPSQKGGLEGSRSGTQVTLFCSRPFRCRRWKEGNVEPHTTNRNIACNGMTELLWGNLSMFLMEMYFAQWAAVVFITPCALIRKTNDGTCLGNNYHPQMIVLSASCFFGAYITKALQGLTTMTLNNIHNPPEAMTSSLHLCHKNEKT